MHFEDNQNKRGSHKIDVKGFATSLQLHHHLVAFEHQYACLDDILIQRFDKIGHQGPGNENGWGFLHHGH